MTARKGGWGLTLKSTSVNLLSCYVLNAGVQSCDTSLDQTLQRFWDLKTLGIKAEETSIYDTFMRVSRWEILCAAAMDILRYLITTICVRHDCLG